MYSVVYRLACKGHSLFRLGLLCNPRTINSLRAYTPCVHPLHTFVKCNELLHGHSIPLIHPILHVLIIFITITVIAALDHLQFLNVNVTCKLYQCSGHIVKCFICLSLWYIKLSDNTLCDQVENMCKTAGLAFQSLELIDEHLELMHHFVIIACIITSDTQDLIACESQRNREIGLSLFTDLICNAKVLKDLGKYYCKSEPCVQLCNLDQVK